jgi:hypothetical protein
MQGADRPIMIARGGMSAYLKSRPHLSHFMGRKCGVNSAIRSIRQEAEAVSHGWRDGSSERRSKYKAPTLDLSVASSHPEMRLSDGSASKR